jgi:hypothetical protein
VPEAARGSGSRPRPKPEQDQPWSNTRESRGKSTAVDRARPACAVAALQGPRVGTGPDRRVYVSRGIRICSLCYELFISINGVVVTWVVAIDPPGVRFPLNAPVFLFLFRPRIALYFHRVSV